MGDRSRSIRRARMTVTRETPVPDGEMAICSFSFLFPIFAVVVDFFFGFHCQHFLKPVHFFIIPFSSSSSSDVPVSDGELFMNRIANEQII